LRELPPWLKFHPYVRYLSPPSQPRLGGLNIPYYPEDKPIQRASSTVFLSSMMLTLLSPNFKPLLVTRNDLSIASIAFGWTMGFGFLTIWSAIQQTLIIRKRHGASKHISPYLWMIWLEILVCLIFAIICFLHLNDIIPPRCIHEHDY
jgi:hypothetical protein